MACGEGGAMEHENDSIQALASDFRVHKYRAQDTLQRLEKLARYHALAVDGYYVDYLKKPKTEADAIRKRFLDVADEAKRLQYL